MEMQRERTDSTSNLAPYRGGNSNNRMLILLIVIVGLVSIVAVVIAAVALSNPAKPPVVNVGNSGAGQPAGGAPIVINSGGGAGMAGSGGAAGSGQNSYGQRSWTIAYGHDWGAYEYFDKKGYIQGFSKDLINAVCAAGRMDCIPVWAPYSACWTSDPGSHPYGGEALMDRWVDACTGWTATTDRVHVFDFSLPYIKLNPSRFYKKKGGSFDPFDLKNKKIGMHKGYSSNEKCLARAESSTNKNYILSTDQIVYADTTELLVPMLVDGTVDAIFAKTISTEKHFDNIEEINDPAIDCGVGGSGMMARKDSGFLAEWNRGFRNLRSSGGFIKLCQEAQQRHELHGTLLCVD